MRLLMFIVLVTYAVKCDDASYYVIEIPEEPKQYKPFKVYWNVPTMQCRSKKIPFTNLFDNFGIIQNDFDNFRGEKIAILYDPGLFPALLKNETSGKFKFRNGGVPQEGDLEKHLAAFRTVMDQSIPDPNFNGIGIIDFESWRPVFRQNFGVLIPYKDISYQIERKLHWFWSEKAIKARARQRFEESGRLFMASTLSVARQMRPHARWGYYAYPYCFNMAPNNMAESCADGVPKENDNMQWLWGASGALYPSTYVSRGQAAGQQAAALVRGRLAEAARLAAGRAALLPYFWYRYRDGGLLPQEQLDIILETLYKSNASGFIIWGSSNDVNTVDKCKELLKYTENILGPSIAKYTKLAENNVKTTRNPLIGGITTWRPNLKDHLIDKNNDTESSVNPEYHWDPPENYTQDIVHYVENELKTRNLTNTGDYNKPQFIDIRKNTLLEFLYNILAYDRDSNKESNTISSENIKKTNVVISTSSLNELIEGSSNNNILAVNSFTTENTLGSLLKNHKKGIPLKVSTNKTTINSTTINPNFTTTIYSTVTNYDSDMNANENLADNINDKNQSTSGEAIFDIAFQTLIDTTESSYNFNPYTDFSTPDDNSTQNILETNVTYDDLDEYTSQIDYFLDSTEPTNSYSILDVLTKPITTIESEISESQLSNKYDDILNKTELNSTTQNIELKNIQETTDVDISYTTITETTTEPVELSTVISSSTGNTPISDIVNFTRHVNEDQNFHSLDENKNENDEKEFHDQIKQSSTSESTTENDVFSYEDEDEDIPDRNRGVGEEAFGESTTNSVRQVGGSTYFTRRCHSYIVIPFVTITLSL